MLSLYILRKFTLTKFVNFLSLIITHNASILHQYAVVVVIVIVIIVIIIIVVAAAAVITLSLAMIMIRQEINISAF
jgi:hypothetical protein